MSSDSIDKDQSDNSQKSSPSKLREGLIVVAALVLGGAILFGIYLYWNFERDHPATQNAYLQANYVWISPQVDGEVAEVYVTDNQLVKKGDKLFALDSRLYDAQLSAAQANLALVRQEIEAGAARVNAAKAQVTEQQAAVKTAQQVADRTKPLVKEDVMTVLQGIQADNSLLEAQAKLETLQADLVVAQKQYGTPETTKAQIDQAEAAVKEAQLNSEWSVVVAPADGYVTNLTLRAGDYVQGGDDLFPFVENNAWWVEANFKETGIGRIRPGQSVTVKVDMYGDKEFKGTVDSIGSSSAASFSLLPAQNTTGNWVKVTQRIPVRIGLDAVDPEYPFRMGASTSVAIDAVDVSQADKE